MRCAAALGWRRTTAVLALLVAAAGCARANAVPTAPVSPPPSSPSSPAGPSSRAPATPHPARLGTSRLVVASATVLDNGRGPQLCLDAVATSYPPQCGGPSVVGWRWPSAGTEHAGRTTWGSFYVAGTWDGRRLRFVKTVTAEQAARSLPAEPPPDLRTPCPTPPGGWVAPDPTRATDADRHRAAAAAERLAGFVEVWIDNRGVGPQGPQTPVLNVKVTGDVAGGTVRLRRLWGGPLCVSRGAHSKRELDRIRAELWSAPGVLSAGTGSGFLDVTVVYDDGTRQRAWDRRYGAGVVRVESALVPFLG